MTDQKNRNRDPYSFANINLLGRCNVDCFFCLGKDIEKELAGQDQRDVPFEEWPNLDEFLARCHAESVRNVYITGQNTDSLMYAHLGQLIDHLQLRHGFDVGLRTNGYLALERMGQIDACRRRIGYSIHSLDPVTTKMIMGVRTVPDWSRILEATEKCRVSIVLNRCNQAEFFRLLDFVAHFPSVAYVQVRRVSTDTRLDYLAPDIAAYEEVYTQVRRIFPVELKFATDAEQFRIYEKPVVFWRTTRTSVNSLNYFTDGTISDEYFIVEGYLKHRKQEGRP